MHLDGLLRIGRTGRLEATGSGGKGRDPRSVEADQREGEASEHMRSVSRASSSRRSAKCASYASERARTSRSRRTPSPRSRGSTSALPISLSRRRRRLRSAMVCRCFGTTTPNRGSDADPGAANTSRCGVRVRVPLRNSSRISSPRRTRASLGSRAPMGSRSPPRDGFMRGLLGTHRNGQTPAALPATTIQGCPAGLRRHAGPESMLVEPLPVARSICGLHPVSTCLNERHWSMLS